ncbi:methyltransferase domain-containing protein [Patescibacteria group bacterium]|nr:methyltransferase domain-containing protein [Patescibacteria group bacterium]MBU1868717.1 methyltransferase domain-containing protein [Patescibacteria group bacterium]
MLPVNFISQLSQKAYQTFGEPFVKTAHLQFLALQPNIENFINPLNKERDKILDIGCGPGFLLEYLLQKGFKYLLGLDISDKAIRDATKRVPAHMLLRADFHQMNFNAREFSVVFAVNSLHYTSKSAFTKILARINYITTPTAKVFLVLPQGTGEQITEESYTDPDTNQSRQHAVYHGYYEKEELETILSQVGFQITNIENLSHPAFDKPLLIANVVKATTTP